jgi:DinB superfamily
MDSREELIGQIDRAHAALYARLRAQPAGRLARRPDSGEWSVVENVRHLLYAEQRHLGRVLLADFSYSGMGLRPDVRRASQAGPEPSDDIEVVLTAWNAVHRPIRAAARRADDAVERALDRNFRHLRSHVRVIERLLAEQAAAGTTRRKRG